MDLIVIAVSVGTGGTWFDVQFEHAVTVCTMTVVKRIRWGYIKGEKAHLRWFEKPNIAVFIK